MIDFNGFFKYLWRYKLWILFVTAGSITGTYFLVKNLPNKYKSHVQISADPGAAGQYLTQSQERTNRRQQMSRIIEMMQTRKEIDALSYHLIIHDLLNPDQAFRPYSDKIRALSPAERESILAEYNTLLKDRALFSKKNNEQYPLWDIVTSMGYDNKSLSKKLSFGLRDDIGYIEIEFESENPELSAFTVNTLATEFVYRFNNLLKSDNQESIAVLDSIVKEKERVMNEKNAQLALYRSAGGGSNSQSAILFQQILTYEKQASDVRRDIASLKGAIASINHKLNDPADVDIATAPSSTVNNELIALDRQLAVANRLYVENGFRSQDKLVVDSLQRIRAAKAANSSSGQRSLNAVTNRQKLITERMDLETKLALAENSVSSIQQEINNLRSRYNAQAPADANAQVILRDADFATKEYTDALNRFNLATNEQVAGLRLNIVEMGLPGLPESSKKSVYLALAAFTCISLIVVILLISFLLNKTIIDKEQLEYISRIPVVGSVNNIRDNNKDLRDIWDDMNTVSDYTVYKDLMRSLRFEISSLLSKDNEKVIGITSLSEGEGKTFLASGLAYSFAMTGKKVLLIGEEYPSLLELVSNKKHTDTQQFETFLVKKEIKAEELITILNKNPNKRSLLEIKDSDNLIPAFEILKKEFDIIIIDVNSMRDVNLAKEWLMFSEKSFAVISQGSKITGRDTAFLNYLKQQKGFQGWIFNKIVA